MSNIEISKVELTNIIYPYSFEEILKDYEKLKQTTNNGSRTGSKFINFFTAIERLNTKGFRGLSFFDVYYDFNKLYDDKLYFKNCIDKTFKGQYFTYDELTKIKMLKQLNSLYNGAVGIFRPIIAKNIIQKYKPNNMLDFTMGWGGRLVAACSLNINKYIGIDINTNLKPLYENMVSTLNKLSTTEIVLLFQDATSVDYSKLDYDFVLTSPPYYNKEIYNNCDKKTKKQWNDNFYIPIFKSTYEHMKKGYYCLNVPSYIYKDICVSVLGEATEKIPFNKTKRPINDYKEYIYIWEKL